MAAPWLPMTTPVIRPAENVFQADWFEIVSVILGNRARAQENGFEVLAEGVERRVARLAVKEVVRAEWP